jgi:hypothetical protein
MRQRTLIEATDASFVRRSGARVGDDPGVVLGQRLERRRADMCVPSPRIG